MAGNAALPAHTASAAIETAHVTARIGDRTLGVHVTFEVPGGTSVDDERRRQVDRLKLRSAQLGSAGFVLNTLRWPRATVTLNYNPEDQPTDDASRLFDVALEQWNRVGTSRFTFARGEDTDRCPSLVEECPGEQTFDGRNDVGWVEMPRETLGIAWYAGDEVDIALNSTLRWSATCDDVRGHHDVRSVLMHETGHALGLSHSRATNAVMYSPYGGARCWLRNADREGVTYLYPVERGIVRGVADVRGVSLPGVKIRIVGTKRFTRTRWNGAFRLRGVPYPVTYEIKAKGYGVTMVGRTKMREDALVLRFSFPRSALARFCHERPKNHRCA